MLNLDTRSLSIRHWLSHTLQLDVTQFEPASSDASFRRYFRVIHQDGQHIVMDAPPDKENIEPFIRIAQLFKKSNVNVPEIYQQDLQQGFLLLEDFGSSPLLDQLNKENAHSFYQEAFNHLYSLQKNTNTVNSQLPYYNEALLSQEIDLFYDWFLDKMLHINIPEPLKITINNLLIQSALTQPQVCVHRDYHSRNLMVFPTSRVLLMSKRRV